MILTHTHHFRELTNKEEEITNSLNNEKKNLSVFHKNLVEATSKLNHYINSEPELVKKNREMTEDNIRLTEQSERAANYRTSALYLSLFEGCSSLLSIGLINSIIMNPAFFAAPGVFAVLAVVSLTMALVSHCQKSLKEDQIAENKKTIAENELTIAIQWKKAHDLSFTIIPLINTQIITTEKTIELFEQELEEQHYSMEQVLSKARNVASAPIENSNTFFNRAGGNVVYLPSAPELQDDSLPPYQEFAPS